MAEDATPTTETPPEVITAYERHIQELEAEVARLQGLVDYWVGEYDKRGETIQVLETRQVTSGALEGQLAQLEADKALWYDLYRGALEREASLVRESQRLTAMEEKA
jgi:hypothetical protein